MGGAAFPDAREISPDLTAPGEGWSAIASSPPLSAKETQTALAALGRVGLRAVRPNDLEARDEGFIRDVSPLLGALYDRVFRCETELERSATGVHEIPEGPVLVVANHNAMTGTPDMFCHMTAFWRRYGHQRVGYGLMHDVPFTVPGAGAWLNAAGAVAANPTNAERALRRDAAVLVFPGGDLDACKTFGDRYRVDFGARRGFVRLALRENVPIVPVVSAGAHESLLILARGDALARRLGLDRRFRSNVFPVGLALPWGLVVGVPYPHLPMPVKIHTRILRPMRFDLPSSAASDPEAVEAVYSAVVGRMQSAMDGLRAEGRHGLVPRNVRASLARTLRSLWNSAKESREPL